MMIATVTSIPTDRLTKMIGVKADSTPELIDAVRRGLAFATFTRLQTQLGVSAQTLAELIGLPVRTLNRRKHEGRFKSEESDNLLRVARVLARVFDFFEDEDDARHWLKSCEIALDNASPLSLLDTEVGAQEVLRLIGQLEHGVYP